MDTKPLTRTGKITSICRWRLLAIPVIVLGLMGFFINYSIFQFRCEPFCEGLPKTNIVFLKTHKCAGSSIQNILMRFGNAHNLTFALPAKGNYLGHPALFSQSFLQKPRPRTYDIFTHHTRLNYNEIAKVMSKDTVYITIVRDPVNLFESLYVYSKLEKFFGISLKKLARSYPKLSPKFYNRRWQGKLGINQMLFDLGASRSIFQNKSLVNKYVDRLEEWFDLVLVAERMDESLVLLKDLMCWNLDDVVTFKLNARNSSFKSILSDEEKASLRRMNAADQILYDRFLNKFEKQVERFGRERVAQEAQMLRERTESWFHYCVRGIKSPEIRKGSGYYYNPTVFVYEIREDDPNSTCKFLTMEEMLFTDHIRQKQTIQLSLPNNNKSKDNLR